MYSTSKTHLTYVFNKQNPSYLYIQQAKPILPMYSTSKSHLTYVFNKQNPSYLCIQQAKSTLPTYSTSKTHLTSMLDRFVRYPLSWANTTSKANVCASSLSLNMSDLLSVSKAGVSPVKQHSCVSTCEPNNNCRLHVTVFLFHFKLQQFAVFPQKQKPGDNYVHGILYS